MESVDFAPNTFDVEVALPAPRDDPLDEPMRNSLAIHLAARINEAVEAKKAEGLNPVGIASSKITYSDPGGYVIVLRIATAAD